MMKFWLDVFTLGFRLATGKARLFVDPVTKEILILDPQTDSTWVINLN